MVQRTLITPPKSEIGPISDSQRTVLMSTSLVAGLYEKKVDRKSIYEILDQRAEKIADKKHLDEVATAQEKLQEKVDNIKQ